MRKPRDFDAELKALEEKARNLRARKTVSMASWLPQPGPTHSTWTCSPAGSSHLRSLTTSGERSSSANAARRSFGRGHAKLRAHLATTRAAVRRTMGARHRLNAKLARHDARDWQVNRRERTRHLIRLGGLVVKADLDELSGGDRSVLYGALLAVADKLRGKDRERVLAVWARRGHRAFEAEASGG